MTPTEPSRRTVLRWGMTAIGALGTVSLLAACGGTSATTTAATVTTTQASTATGAKTEVSQAASTAALTAVKTVSPAAGVPAKGITVTVASWLAQPPSRAAYQFLATQYAKMTPRVQIEQLLIPGSSSYADKLTALLAGGTPPDLAETNWIESQPLGEKGALRALDPLIARDKIVFQDYAQVALALGRWPQQAGKYYAWYTMFATSPLYYNTTLFQRAGQAPPDATWTWQHLVEIARKLTKLAGSPQEAQYGFNPDYFTRTMLYAFGWDYTTPDFSRCLLDSTDSVNAMQFWQDLLYKYQVAPPPSGAFSKGAPYGPFSTKRLGMAIDGSYTIAQFRTVQDLAWDIALPPIGPKGRIALIKGAPGHSLPTHSAHSEQAWAFLSWWIRNQTAEMVVLPGNLPSKLSALRGWVTYQQQKYPTPQHIGLVYDIATKYGKSLQVLPNNAVVKKPYYAERALILQNSEDAKTGMTRACQQMSILLKQALRSVPTS